MKRILLIMLAACAICAKAQTVNPIIPGFHPDPSICQVGDDYYLVNSSFQYFPGVPIFHSRDLTNWQQIGNVLDRQSQLPLKDATSWTGIYAPTLRYNNGTFYMITTNVGGGGNFMVTATDPRGPWSEPMWLEQQGIDPSLLFVDGKCYMVSNPDNTITLCEIDPATGRQLTPSRPIWRGTGGRYPEGPHIYKRDGYYYLLISEGGTELAHSITIARSRNIYGPYEPGPANPILTHCNMKGQGSQIQGTGHGDLVEDSKGQWHLVFLAYRNYNGAYHHLGRETFIAPVKWPKGGWPTVNDGKPIEPKQRKPITVRTDFDTPAGPEWLFIQNPDSTAYWRHDGMMRLYGSINDMQTNSTPTFFGRRQEAAAFSFDTRIAAYDLMESDEAGVCVYQINDGYAQLSLQNTNGNYFVKLKLRLKNVTSSFPAKHIDAPRQLFLRISSDGKDYNFLYSTDGKSYTSLGKISCTLLSTETAGGFTGATLGLFANNENTRYSAGRSYADFDYVEYSESEEPEQ